MSVETVGERSDEAALKDFLLDIDCLDALSEWTSNFNLFDILKVSRVEIRHSNVLSWLLNPNENHGLGDSVLRGFIQYAVTAFSENSNIFHSLLMDCYSFTALREWHSIDIFVVSENEKCVVCIENKIDSKEHSDQLNRYRKLVENTYPDFSKIYIFLSPEGDESSDSDNWCAMSYRDVLRIIETACGKTQLLPDAKLLIDNYVATIRRDIVGDEKLAKICAEIYAKHHKALDLIFENRPDRASQLADVFRLWATMMTESGEIEFVPEKSAKIYTRFKTKTMSEVLPDAENPSSGWGTKNYYFYEIKNIDGKEFFIQLALSAKDIPDGLKNTCDRINKHFPSRQQKENWLWKTVFATKHVKLEEDFSEDYILEQLSKRFAEVKAFEDRLLVALSKDRD